MAARKMAVDGKAIILVSSEMSELIAFMCDKDRMYVLEGKITGILDNREASEETIYEAGVRLFQKNAKELFFQEPKKEKIKGEEPL